MTDATALLPDRLPEIDGVELAAAHLPGPEPCWDWYDAIPLPGETVGIAPIGTTAGPLTYYVEHHALQTQSAQAHIVSGMARHVLVIGAETLTRFLDYTDRNTCILFGDGAGAVVLSASDEPGGGLGIELTTEPSGAYMIWLPAGGAKAPPSAETIARGEHFVRMEGRETYRFATRTLASTALAAIERAGLQPSDIALFIPHQANVRIIEAVAKGLDLPMDRMFVNVDKYGNTSAASIPMALAEAVDSGRVKVGDRIVIVAFGAGFTSGAVAIEWTADPARAVGVDERVGPEDIKVRLPVDWDSVDPIPPALAEIMVTPVDGHELDLDDVVPGEPARSGSETEVPA